jgi:2-phospho-L-lactate guanylyltransferase
MGAEMTAHPSPATDVRWAVLVPLKPPSAAKSRLAVPADVRAQLVMAMAGDVVEAVRSCSEVDLVVVVADAPDGLEPLQRLGAGVVVDPAHEGLNASLRHAAAVVAARDSGFGIASLVADVAGVTPEQLSRVLAASAIRGTAFVPDAAGRGTTLVASRRWAAFLPEYGRHSRRRHVDAGFTELLLPDTEGLRLDVDTVADLQALQALGPGPRTTAMLSSLSLPLQ